MPLGFLYRIYYVLTQKNRTMKKIILLLLTSLLILSSGAQTAANRTPATKVSDALALLPAQDAAEYNRLMEDLVSTGAEGVALLNSLFESTNNAPVCYALEGWAAYVSTPGKEADQQTFSAAIQRAIVGQKDLKIQAFYMRLLERCGGDEALFTLSLYLNNPELVDPALAAVVAIGSIDAKRLIVATSVLFPEGNEARFAKAIGDLKIPDVDLILRDWLGQNSETDASVYWALGQMGNPSSKKLMAKAAAKTGYNDTENKVTESYLNMLYRLAEEGDLKGAKNGARNIWKKSNSPRIRLNALNLLVEIEQHESMPYILEAIEEGNPYLRQGALNAVARSSWATSPKVSEDFLKILPHLDNGGQSALFYFFGTTQDPAALPTLLSWVSNDIHCQMARYGTAYGKTSIATLAYMSLETLGPLSLEVMKAAVWAVSQYNDSVVIPALVSALRNPNLTPEVGAYVQSVLLARPEHSSSEVATLIKDASQTGQLIALSILGERRAKTQFWVVFEALQSYDKKVSECAYQNLQYVVTLSNLPTLYDLLNNPVNQDHLHSIQAAIVEALHDEPTSRKLTLLTSELNKPGREPFRYFYPLATTGAPKALEIILEGTRSADVPVRIEAIQALTVWKGQEALEELYEMIQQKPDPEVRINLATLTGFIVHVEEGGFTPEQQQIMYTDAMAFAQTTMEKLMVLTQMAKTKTFQALIEMGKLLDSEDASLRQAAVDATFKICLSRPDFYGPVVSDQIRKAMDLNNHTDREYQREEMTKHLAKFPVEGGYVSMFNGRDLTGWKGLVENPIARNKMTPEELAKKQEKADEVMRQDWSVVDGLLVFTGTGYDNICTTKQYGDFEMYVDWLLYADGPNADAGIYLRGTPQVQMWDTARRNVGAQVGSGGLYNNQVNERNPIQVADNKLGRWNTFYIKMVGDHVTVILNGIRVVDNVVMENYWDRSLPIPALDQIELQAHGTRVAYRNLYVNELPRPEPFRLSAEEERDGFRVLFDGIDMHQWQGNTRDYVVENGTMTLYPDKGYGGNLYTKEEFSDFIYRFEFMLTPGANNGLGIRTPTTGDAAYVGMELQILDNEAPIYRHLEPYQYHGSVYGVIPAKRGFLRPTGEWNTQEVVARGNRITITLNGEVILDGDIAEASKNGTMDGKQHPGLMNPSGHIGFLGHGSKVSFRNIRIKELK